jgi:beta-lactamase class A
VILSGDSTQQNGQATVAHMIKKIFLVSDNEAYNYLFEFLGRDYINQELQKRNIGPAHINHKFQSGAKNTMALSFFMEEGVETIAAKTSVVDKHSFALKRRIKGVGYTDDAGNRYNEPSTFLRKITLRWKVSSR